MTASIVALELQPLRAEGLRQALAGCEDLRLAASEITPELALTRAAETRPAVVLVDGDLGGREVNGFSAGASGSESRLPARALDPGERRRAGVQDPERFRRANSGEDLAGSPGDRVLRRAARHDPDRDSPDPAYVRAHFTAKEREILDRLCRGLTNAEIGRELGISPSTVKVHLAHMYDKSGFHTRGSLAAHVKSPGGRAHIA